MIKPEERATVILLIVFALVLVVPLLGMLAFTAYESARIGLYQPTFIFICATVALIGAFWIWVSGRKYETKRQADWNLSLWKSLWSWSNPTEAPIWVGPLLLLIAVLLAFFYVEYIEPYFFHR